MSKNPTCNDQEIRDIIQCYLDSDKKIDLCQLNYIYKYPGRKRPSLLTIEKVVQLNIKRNASINQDESHGEVSGVNTINDNGILRYFLENTHASVKKAASIFNTKPSYIEQLLEEKKTEIESKKVDNEMSNEEVNGFTAESLHNNKKDQVMVHDETLDEGIAITTENVYDSLQFKTECNTEIEIVEHDVRHFIYQEHNEAKLEEIVHSENINSNKRKSETLNSELNKKSKSYPQNQTTDPVKLDSPFLDNLFVYTTRLDDMAVLKGRLKKFGRAHITREILFESKPKFYYSAKTSNPRLGIRKRRNFKLLQKKLEFLSKNIEQPVIDLTEDDSVKNEVIIHAAYPGCGDVKPNVENNISPNNYKCNLVIMINSKSLQLWDIYVIDSNGNVAEYHSTKSEDVLNDIDASKVRLKLYICCWYQRRLQIDKTWPLCDTTFARFLLTAHKCPPDRCICCCKPRYKTSENSVLKNVWVNAKRVLSDGEAYDKRDSKNNLINKALMYQRKSIRNNNNLYVTKNESPLQRFLFSEDTYTTGGSNFKTEFYEIGSKQDVIYQAVVFNTGLRVGTDVKHMLKNFFSNDTNKKNVSLQNCCKFKRDTFLFTNYSAGNISESALRYLKNTEIPLICDYCKDKKNTVIKNSYNFNPVVPSIENTGTLTVLNVDIEDNKSYGRENFADKTLPEDPSPEKSTDGCIETPQEDEMVQLELNCKQIPGFVFTVKNVQHQLAIAVVKKCTTFAFTVTKAEGKSVASLNVPGESISIQSIDEFQIIANILLNLQNRVKDVDLPTGTKLSLDVKIKADNSAFQNCSDSEKNHLSNTNILQNLQENIESAQNANTTKSSKKTNSTNIDTNNTTKTNDKIESLQKITAYMNSSCQSIIDAMLNKYILGTQNRKNTLFDTCNQNIADISGNSHEVSQDSCRNLSNEELKEMFYDKNVYRQSIYHNFNNLMIHNKNCSANSFRIYRKAKLEKYTNNERNPIIVKVFSMKTMNNEPDDHLPSTSNVPVTNIIARRNETLPSTSKDVEQMITERNGSLLSIIDDAVTLALTKTNDSLPSTSTHVFR